MKPVEEGGSQLPVQINRALQIGNLVNNTSLEAQDSELTPLFEKTAKTDVLSRGGYPQRFTFLTETYWETNIHGFGRQREKPLTVSDASFYLYCEFPTDQTLLLGANSNIGYEIKTARRIRIDDKTFVYQWEPEDTSRVSGVINRVYGNSIFGFGGKTNLGGLVRVINKKTGEEKLYEVEAIFYGSYDNYHLETTLKELP